MAEARQSLERSKPRDAFEAVELCLALELLPYSTSEFPELLGAEFGMQDKEGELIPASHPRAAESGLNSARSPDAISKVMRSRSSDPTFTVRRAANSSI